MSVLYNPLRWPARPPARLVRRSTGSLTAASNRPAAESAGSPHVRLCCQALEEAGRPWPGTPARCCKK